MPVLSRADTSMLGRWWWTIDRLTLLAIAILIGFGYVMMLAASPSVAERIHVSRDSFIYKQVFFLLAAAAVVGQRFPAVTEGCAAPSTAGLHCRPGVDGDDAGGRGGDQGRAALDRAARHVAAAQRVPQALFRRGGRLADGRGQEDPWLPRHRHRLRCIRANLAAAEKPAGYRDARGRHRGVFSPSFSWAG